MKIISLIFNYSASLASLTRETGPKVVRGDPDRKTETPRAQVTHQHRHVHAPTLSTSDSALKFTHILYNLSPAGIPWSSFFLVFDYKT